MTPGYDIVTAAQAAAFFARKAGGRINVLKLAKLLYLAERAFMEKYDEPMFFDRLVSMDHGPVTSVTLDLINGGQENDQWSKFISGRENYDVVSAVSEDDFSDLDHLSKIERSTLSNVWAEFGHMGKYEIRDWTHRNCPEWEDPNGSMRPISHEIVFKFLGKDDASDLEDHIRDFRRMKQALGEDSAW
ncbi:MAG: Panacea domain-containing protein [Pseudomonadota bacterium]